MPAPVVKTVTGSWYASGTGIPPPSGTVLTFSGPWLIEEQTMDIEYIRLPYGSLSAVAPNLSAVTTTFKFGGSFLAAKIFANYSRKKVYLGYATSAWQQPQKFTVIAASSDPYGNSYGSVTTSSLGPQGQIITSQPWFFRREWVSTDTEAASSIVAGTIIAYIPAVSGQGNPGLTFDPALYWDDFKRIFISHTQAGTLVADADISLQPSYIDQPIFGSYTTAKEAGSAQILFIDKNADRVTGEDLVAVPAKWNSNINGWYVNVGIPEYSKFRHDYT